MTNEERDKTIEQIERIQKNLGSIGETIDYLDFAIEALEQQTCEDKGEISDGYHTFNQLYHQRAILFATIVNQNKDKAWKSFKHSDGHYCFDEGGEMFIVGIDTPKGSYTYHYHKKYWDYFDCKELEYGKVWDGHTEEDVTRLLSLEQQSCEDAISRDEAIRIAEQGQIQGYEWQFKKLCNLPSVKSNPVFYPPCEDCNTKMDEVRRAYDKLRDLQRCEDCVSRQAIIDKATSWDTHFTDSERYVSLSDIMALPPVTPKYTDEEIDKAQAIEQAYADKMVELAVEGLKRQKGKWIDIRVIKSFHYDGEPRVRCSRCGNEEEWSSNYCPNCGAEMEDAE